MKDIQLRHVVIDRWENRWASRLQQDVRAYSSDKARPFESRHVQLDGARAIPVAVKPARRAADDAKFA